MAAQEPKPTLPEKEKALLRDEVTVLSCGHALAFLPLLEYLAGFMAGRRGSHQVNETSVAAPFREAWQQHGSYLLRTPFFLDNS